MNARILICAIVFIAPIFLDIAAELSAQEKACSELLKELKHLRINLRKQKLTVTDARLDSLSYFLRADCHEANIEAKIVSAFLEMSHGNFDESISIYNEALTIAKENIQYKKTIQSYISKVFYQNGEYKKSLEILEESIAIPCPQDSISCHEQNITLHIASALSLKKLGRYEEIIEIYEKAEFLMDKFEVRDSSNMASMYNTLGNIYNSVFSDYRRSLDYYKKAAAYAPKGHKGIYSILSNIGFKYTKLNKLDSAEVVFTNIIDSINEDRYLITPYQGIAAIAVRKKQYKKGVEYYSKALSSAKASGRTSNIYKSRIYLAKALYLDGDFEKAQLYLNRAIESNQAKNIPNQTHGELEMYTNLIDVALQDSSLSYKLYKNFSDRDTIAIKLRTKMVDQSVSKYEKLLLRDSLEKQLLLRENEEQKVKNYQLSSALLVMSLFLIGGIAFQLRNRFSKQIEINEELVFQNKELKRLNERLENFVNQSNLESEVKEVNIKSKDKTYFIPINKITYVQAEDNGIRVYYDGISKWTDVSLRNFQEQIGETYFVQISRGSIVNVNYIAWINTNTLKMKAGAELKIGRVYKPKIKEILES